MFLCKYILPHLYILYEQMNCIDMDINMCMEIGLKRVKLPESTSSARLASYKQTGTVFDGKGQCL